MEDPMNSADTSADTVLDERRGGVLVLTLNRPERLNAWTNVLENRYFELLDDAEADPDVKAIVLTGAGRGFCSGADLADLQVASSSRDLSAADTQERRRPRSFPYTMRKPLIAAINGAAVGLGLVEALYCDVRFATPEAKLIAVFVRRGLIAEYGISWLLPRIVGQSRALDVLLSGRIVLGDEAHRIGLVDHLCPPEALLDEAVAYAEDLATNCSPTSMAVIKAQVRRDLDQPFEAATQDSERLVIESFRRADAEEGVVSFLERRPPDFPPLAPRA
jgi:enoyl-CoA hydratase/carnithine racemase